MVSHCSHIGRDRSLKNFASRCARMVSSRYLIGIDIKVGIINMTTISVSLISVSVSHRYRYLIGIGIGISWVSVSASHGYRYRYLIGIGIGISLVSISVSHRYHSYQISVSISGLGSGISDSIYQFNRCHTAVSPIAHICIVGIIQPYLWQRRCLKNAVRVFLLG